MRITTSHATAVLVLALGLAACGQSRDEQTQPYADVVPDAQAILLEADPAAPAAAQDAALGDDPTLLTTAQDDLVAVKARVAALNAGLRLVLERVGEIMATEGHELPGGAKVWGPAVRCVEPGAGGACLATASLRLVVRLRDERAGGFALEARPAASADDGAFRPVFAGWLVRGELPRRGFGRVFANFENLKEAAGAWDGAAGFKGEGHLAAGFAAGPVAKAGRYRLDRFTRDVTAHPPVTAAFAGFRTADGLVRARAVGLGDLDRSAANPEFGAWHAVHAPGLPARAFSIVSNFTTPDGVVGDVSPAGTLTNYWFGRACYAPGALAAPQYKEWFLCPRTSDPRRCIADAAGAGTKVAGTVATWQASACHLTVEPEPVRPPGVAPGGPGDDVPEPGEDRSGFAPPAAPPDARVVEPSPP